MACRASYGAYPIVEAGQKSYDTVSVGAILVAAACFGFGAGVILGDFSQTSSDAALYAPQQMALARPSMFSNSNGVPKTVMRAQDGPKGPRSAYIIFSNDARKQVGAANPSMKSTEIMKEMGRQWREADPATKAKYDSLAKQDKERYQREAGVQPKEDGPKKPRSAYILFSSDTRKEVVAANPSMKSSEVMKELGRLWKIADEATKARYAELSEADKERYQKETSGW